MMWKKTFIYNSLKCSVAGILMLGIISCASGNSEDWPKMQADNLWQDLEQSDAKLEMNADNNSASLTVPPFSNSKISLVDVRNTLTEIELALPNKMQNLEKAVQSYRDAPSNDKARYWRGIEVEKSRLNELTSALRNIEYQIESNKSAETELILTRELITKINNMSPVMPRDVNLASMNITEIEDAPFNNQMVVAANPYAAKAGLEILKRGGSAVDAAVAVETTLSLVEPQSSGIGGGAFLLHFDPEKPSTQQLNFYDGREAAPMAASPDLFKSVTDINGYVKLDAVYGGLSVGVPGALAALKMAHEKHGKLSWAEVFEPAIKIAEEGFIVSPRLERYITIDKKLMLVPASRDYFYDEDGNPLKAGHLLKNPKQAAVLRRIANEGISAFYTGEIAEKIVDAIKNAPNNPGLMEISDLNNYVAKERDVICGKYHDNKVCSIPPPSSGGHTMIATLGILDNFNIDKMEPHSAEAYNLILEAESLAYADRNQYTGDTDYIDVPVQGMINESYLNERAKLIKPGTSMGKAPYGTPPSNIAYDYGEGHVLNIPSTTHFSITDKWGRVVSMTATVESMFGSRLMVEGFMLNNELTDFSLIPRDAERKMVANRVQGGKRPMSSQTPSIVFDGENRPALIIGSPGGA
ncbi:MAG: gamma-glutamyltransferase, partial [Emcibacteraceae bacterium]|nr:gamma-glutamyltransferase [Emcibacteraceae bacterium]